MTDSWPPAEGTWYQASDLNWYCWPDPTPHAAQPTAWDPPPALAVPVVEAVAAVTPVAEPSPVAVLDQLPQTAPIGWDPPQPQYGQPQYGQPQYGQPQYGQPQYGQPQYGQPQYGQPQYGQPQYVNPQYDQLTHGPEAPKKRGGRGIGRLVRVVVVIAVLGGLGGGVAYGLDKRADDRQAAYDEARAAELQRVKVAETKAADAAKAAKEKARNDYAPFLYRQAGLALRGGYSETVREGTLFYSQDLFQVIRAIEVIKAHPAPELAKVYADDLVAALTKLREQIERTYEADTRGNEVGIEAGQEAAASARVDVIDVVSRIRTGTGVAFPADMAPVLE